MVTISGASGCGKSIFLRAIVDLDPSEGEVWFDQIERSSIAANEWRRLVGLVQAESGWWADRVGEHFEHTALTSGLFKSLGLNDDILDWQVRRLSTGERQRLGLARALNLSPKILLLDEPTSALDKKNTTLVEALLNEQLATGMSIIMVTHDEGQARRVAHRRFSLSGGTLKPMKGGRAK